MYDNLCRITYVRGLEHFFNNVFQYFRHERNKYQRRIHERTPRPVSQMGGLSEYGFWTCSLYVCARMFGNAYTGAQRLAVAHSRWIHPLKGNHVFPAEILRLRKAAKTDQNSRIVLLGLTKEFLSVKAAVIHYPVFLVGYFLLAIIATSPFLSPLFPFLLTYVGP
jgi:hypothetical protein